MGRLIETLELFDPETLVHLGSRSSFFEIEQAKTILCNSYLDNLSDDLYQDFVSLRGKASDALQKALNTPPKFNGCLSDNDQRENDISGFLQAIGQWSQKIAAALKSLQCAELNVSQFIPLRDREVLDTYPRIDGSGIVIIVSGAEAGAYWFLEEKQARHKRNARQTN